MVAENGIPQSQIHENKSKMDDIEADAVHKSVDAALDALLAEQNPDGHWRYDLESWIYTTGHHVMCLFYNDEPLDWPLLRKIANRLRKAQLPTGGWGFVPNDSIILTNTVNTYLALRLIGDQPDEEHMVLARNAILKLGGIEATNFFTRFYLALYEIVPWSALPIYPVEIMLLPDWFPFTIYKISFWARVSFVPIMVLQHLKKPAHHAGKVNLHELYVGKPSEIPPSPRTGNVNPILVGAFSVVDKLLKFATEYVIPTGVREKAFDSAVAYVMERLNGEYGYGSIIPAMYYGLMMLRALGYPVDHPDRAAASKALRKFITEKETEAYTVSCQSPVWDTAHCIEALLETEEPRAIAAAEKGLDWLRPRQTLDVKGDWAKARPNVRPGGWCFFYQDKYFPDPDDTSMVVQMMQKFSIINNSDRDSYAMSRGLEWILGMQGKTGGWASYDADNTHMYLNNIPVADRSAFLDPPSADCTGNMLTCLAAAGQNITNSEAVRRGVDFLYRIQKPNGSWFGQWGVNYIYGAKWGIIGLRAAGIPADQPNVVKAVNWLLSIQNEDGGWGEHVDSYKPNYKGHVTVRSTSSQTSWCLAALMVTLEITHPAITAGVKYLLETQITATGQWYEEDYTGNGHAEILYCRYNGYPKYLPLYALAMYRKKRFGRISAGKA